MAKRVLSQISTFTNNYSMFSDKFIFKRKNISEFYRKELTKIVQTKDLLLKIKGEQVQCISKEVDDPEKKHVVDLRKPIVPKLQTSTQKSMESMRKLNSSRQRLTP